MPPFLFIGFSFLSLLTSAPCAGSTVMQRKLLARSASQFGIPHSMDSAVVGKTLVPSCCTCRRSAFSTWHLQRHNWMRADFGGPADQMLPAREASVARGSGGTHRRLVLSAAAKPVVQAAAVHTVIPARRGGGGESEKACVVGLTGGIASGKSTVREFLASKGASVLDADKLGHECYAPGSDCLREVAALFGDRVVNADGTLNRVALGGIVFGDKAELEKLNKTVWPYIRRRIEEEIAGHRGGAGGVLVVEAAVMVEAGWLDMFDQIWVVYTPPEDARARLMNRNQLSSDEADRRIAAQISNEERLARATVALRTSGMGPESIARLQAESAKAWSELLRSHPGLPRARL
eukprot:gnl/TRDRNA2_/TRDRNA2_42086_c0_seq1.p1 gnl/TRDRNA2_/TRDRNA2_42086_c0~~gnl/TRDRNA2_/TRDRNA2_42086_c0_seq1.p1  ORF type:complete len:349 (-),score=63.97 gnl/TRDRNA2_/TRDRNA2_42086_c0_seq1:44-1090(-)